MTNDECPMTITDRVIATIRHCEFVIPKESAMFRIVGPKATDLCDAHLRPSRRDILRVGGAGMLGLSLGSLLKLQAVQAAGAGAASASSAIGGGPGWGKAKS